jgi:hypothetical protein
MPNSRVVTFVVVTFSSCATKTLTILTCLIVFRTHFDLLFLFELHSSLQYACSCFIL